MAIERRPAITAATWRATDPDAMDAAAQKFVGVAGLIAMVASVLPFLFVPSAPRSGASAAEIVSFYSDHDGVLFVTWVSAIALIPSMIFLVGMVALMRGIERDRGWIWLAVLLGAVGIVAAAAAQAILGAVLPFSAAADNSIALVVLRLLTLSYAFQFVAVILFFGLIGWVITTRHALPGWLGYLANVAAMASAIGTLGIFIESGPFAAGDTYTYFAFALGGIWWLLMSIVLIFRPVGKAAISVST